MTRALLVIDVQKGMFSYADPYRGRETVTAIGAVLAKARNSNTAVFFVQHDGGKGSPLARDAEGFAFHDALTPRANEEVTVKRFCSAFQGTDLFDRLNAAGVAQIVMGGMQTEYCVDTAVRGAFERGFDVTLIADGHTTFDTPALRAEQIVTHHNHTLSTGHFARVIDSRDIHFE